MEQNKISNILVRVFFSVVYAVLINVIVLWLIFICAIVQHLYWMLSGQKNANIQALITYLYTFFVQSLDYVCMRTEDIPYPFSEIKLNPDDDSADSTKANKQAATDISANESQVKMQPESETSKEKNNTTTAAVNQSVSSVQNVKTEEVKSNKASAEKMKTAVKTPTKPGSSKAPATPKKARTAPKKTVKKAPKK